MPTERLYPSDTAGEDARLGAAATDTVLIERSLTDPEAFRTIWSRYHSSIGRYVASRVGIDHVEDLLVTTFMAAFESRSRFNGRRSNDSARPWLLGIATNVIAQHRTIERRWLRHLDPEIAARTLERGSIDLDPQLLAIDGRGRLARAIASLPEPQRDAFLLSVIGELDYAEVAEALSVPIGTVRSRISRARIFLQQSMKGGRDA